MDLQEKSLSRVLAAIEAIKSGQMVIMVDDEDRENEGDLVFAAEFATPEKINFMAKEARGLICLPISKSIASALKLPLMDDFTKGPGEHTTAFTVSIEARRGVTTGISAADRAHTICVAAAEGAKPEDLVVPGHVFPLISRQGGVLERSGHTEGSVDIARLAGCRPAAVICEIMNDDGTMSRMPDLELFAKKYELPIVTIEDIIAFRLMRDSLVKIVSQGILKTSKGSFDSFLFESVLDKSQHLAIVKGQDLFSEKTVDVRVHRQKPIGDVFSAMGDGGRFLIDYGLDMLANSNAAVMLYLNQMQSSQSFADFHEAVNASDSEQNHPLQMDFRQLGLGAQILRALGVQKMKPHVSSHRTMKGLAGYGLEVIDTVMIETP